VRVFLLIFAMPLTVNTNTSATTASFQLSAANAALRKSLGRLSSGNRIVSPADDSGGLAVAYKLRSRLTRVERVGENLQNSISFLQVQEGALQVAGSILTRISELKTMSTDVTKNSGDIENYNKEFIELQRQLAQMSKDKFNGISLFTHPSVQDHALQAISNENGKTSEVVSLARNFLAGEYVAASGAVLGGKDVAATEVVTTTTSSVEPVSTKAGATGVDAAGNKIAIGATDPNWTVTGLSTTAQRLSGGAWVAEPATASWIGPPTGLTGDYFYSMSFDLTGYDINDVELSGAGSTDNWGFLEINGTDYGAFFKNFAVLRSFTMKTSGSDILIDGVNKGPNPFIAGVNTFTVRVKNNGGPTGLLFDQLQISASKTTTTTTTTTSTSTSIEFEDLDKFSMDDFGGFTENLATALAQNGAEQQRLNLEVEGLRVNQVNLEAAHGRIMDADIALESTRFARHNVLVQSSAAMVAQANSLTDVALNLLPT
jgi:flagellin